MTSFFACSRCPALVDNDGRAAYRSMRAVKLCAQCLTATNGWVRAHMTANADGGFVPFDKPKRRRNVYLAVACFVTAFALAWELVGRFV